MASLNGLGDGQLQLLAILERVGGSLSLFALSFIFLFYACCRRIRTTPNTFIILTSISHTGAAVAHIIADAGVEQDGPSTSCLVRSFLLEITALSEPLWSLTMAVTILTTLGGDSNSIRIRKRLWLHCCLLCYGVPFAGSLAITLLEGSSDSLGPRGFNWCWASTQWGALRIYIPVWSCILASFLIYAGVGIHAIRTRNRPDQRWEGLRSRTFSGSTVSKQTVSRDSQLSFSNWPLSPNAGGLLFGLDGDSVSSLRCPTPAHTPPNPEPTWLDFAISPRPAPSPPPSSGRESITCIGVGVATKQAFLMAGLLFASSLCITWLPGTVGLARSLIPGDRGNVGFGHSLATAAIFPLQGVWNAAIFFGINWSAILGLVTDLRSQSNGMDGVMEDRQRSSKAAKAKSRNETGDDVGFRSSWKSRSSKRDSGWDFLDVGLEARGNPSVV